MNQLWWMGLAVVCLAQLMIVLDTTIVNVALPSIHRDLRFTQGNLTWVARFGPMRVLILGMSTVVVGLALLGTVGVHTAFFPIIFLAYFAIGLGIGSAFMPLLTIAMADVPEADAGLGSGITNLSQQVAGALGLAVLGTIASNHTKGLVAQGHTPATALVSGYHLAFAVGDISIVVGIVTALVVLRPRRLATDAGVAAAPEPAGHIGSEPEIEIERQAA